VRRAIAIAGWLLLAAAACLAVGCGSSEPSPGTTSASTVAHQAPPPRNGGGSPTRVAVPKIVGERYGKAVHELNQAGLIQHAPGFTGTIGNPHYNGQCKKIITQSPPAGTRLPKGGTVSIVYGVCPQAIAKAHHSLKHRYH
jgi:hypothetical protein